MARKLLQKSLWKSYVHIVKGRNYFSFIFWYCVLVLCLLLFSVKLFYSFLTDSKSASGLRIFNIYIELEIFCGVIVAHIAEFKAKKLFIINVIRTNFWFRFWFFILMYVGAILMSRPLNKGSSNRAGASSITDKTRIADPDPSWIRIRPVDPGGQKWPTKVEKNLEISCFTVLDVLFWELKASFVLRRPLLRPRDR